MRYSGTFPGHDKPHHSSKNNGFDQEKGEPASFTNLAMTVDHMVKKKKKKKKESKKLR